MILYSKFGEFIGIGRDELSMFGFDDMDDFTSYHKDFADLFVNKPGYIFKFKNFSWIDYALHSGAPKKSAIVKLKNGTEIEVNLRIKELYLANPIEEQNLYYCIEVSNQAFGEMPSAAIPPQTPQPQALLEDEVSPPVDDAPVEFDKEETMMPQDIGETTLIQDYVPEEDSKEEFSVSEESFEQETPAPTPQEETGLKLKVDEDVFHTLDEKEEESEENSFIQDFQEDTPPTKLNFDEEEKEEPFKEESEEQTDFIQDYTPKEDSEEDFKIEDDSFEVKEQEAQEELGLKLKVDEDVFDTSAKEPEKIEEDSSFEDFQAEETPKIQEEPFSEDYQPEATENASLYIEEEEKELDFDLSDCAQELDLDIGLIAEIITDYIEKIETNIPKVYEYIQKNRTDELKDAIYKLKGIADSLHIEDFSIQLSKILSETDEIKQTKQLQVFEKLFSQFKEKLV